MNVFFLDRDPVKAAKFHCDKHVVKMILESAQLLSTAHRILDEDILDDHMNEVLYKKTHANHPSAIWVRESADNYMWVYTLMVALNVEFVQRYGHEVDHKTIQKLGTLLSKPPENIPNIGFTEPPQCMPPEYFDPDPVEAYQNYYLGAKKDIARWDYSDIPGWW